MMDGGCAGTLRQPGFPVSPTATFLFAQKCGKDAPKGFGPLETRRDFFTLALTRKKAAR